MEYKFTGVILKKKDIRETDRIYTIYTQEIGKLSVFARGIRKPQSKLAGNLENFNYGHILIAKSKGLGNIKGVTVEKYFNRAKENLDSLKSVFTTLAIFDKLIEEEHSDFYIFKLLIDYLETVDKLVGLNQGQLNEKTDIVSLAFIFKLLAFLGYQIETKICVCCQSKLSSGSNYFSSHYGGAVCYNCRQIENRIIFQDNSIKALRIFFNNDLTSLYKLDLTKKELNNLRLVCDDFLRWIS